MQTELDQQRARWFYLIACLAAAVAALGATVTVTVRRGETTRDATIDAQRRIAELEPIVDGLANRRARTCTALFLPDGGDTGKEVCCDSFACSDAIRIWYADGGTVLAQTDKNSVTCQLVACRVRE